MSSLELNNSVPLIATVFLNLVLVLSVAEWVFTTYLMLHIYILKEI